MPHDAFKELEMIAMKRHAGIGDVDGQKAVGVCRVEQRASVPVFSAPRIPPIPPMQPTAGAGTKLCEAGQEDVHGLTEALQAFAGLLSQAVRCAAAEEQGELLGGWAVNDGERQRLVAQPAGLDRAPAPVHLAEAVLTDGVENEV